MRRNDRQDLIVRGFVDRKTEIDVFFAGRRASEVGPLEKQLKAMMSHARKQAADVGAKPPDVAKIRLPLRAEGAWRRSLQRDDSGWETGSYHFVVARSRTKCFFTSGFYCISLWSSRLWTQTSINEI